VWIDVYGSGCVVRFVNTFVWICVREVFGSIFVDLCMCIFWVYVSVNEYVCVDR